MHISPKPTTHVISVRWKNQHYQMIVDDTLVRKSLMVCVEMVNAGICARAEALDNGDDNSDGKF